MDYTFLKNGTDVRGTAIAQENDPQTLTDRALYDIAGAFCLMLQERFPRGKIAIGRDSRLSSQRIEKVLLDSILKCGFSVLLTGLSSTPSMYMLLKDGLADASIMITASHLPFQKNGLKFFLKEGGIESEDLSRLLSLAGKGERPKSEKEGKVSSCSYLKPYSAHLVELVKKATGKELPLAGKRIVLDAGNGAGGFFEEMVLRPLGADTTGSQFLEPDGAFPNHIPNPENEEAMKSLQEAVLKNHADFGILFDTDVDRAGAVFSNGEEINRNRLIALISAILLEEYRGGVIVTDSVTSDGLTQFIEARGGVHHRFKRGYKNVINESKRLNAEGIFSPLAIETSGHAALKENDFLDDGAFLMTRLLIALSKSEKDGLISWISSLKEPEEAREVRLCFSSEKDFKEKGASLIESLKEEAEKSAVFSLAPKNYEGVRLNFGPEAGDGWALIRLSLHEPILPINIESNSKGGCEKISRTLFTLLKDKPYLNAEKLLETK